MRALRVVSASFRFFPLLSAPFRSFPLLSAPFRSFPVSPRATGERSEEFDGDAEVPFLEEAIDHGECGIDLDRVAIPHPLLMLITLAVASQVAPLHVCVMHAGSNTDGVSSWRRGHHDRAVWCRDPAGSPDSVERASSSKERHPAKSVIQPNKAEGSCCLRLGGDDFGSATVFHTRRLRSTMKPWAEICV